MLCFPVIRATFLVVGLTSMRPATELAIFLTAQGRLKPSPHEKVAATARDKHNLKKFPKKFLKKFLQKFLQIFSIPFNSFQFL